MKAVITNTIWQRRWSIFWWSLGVIFLIFLTLVFYPTIQHQSAQLNKSLDQIPQTAKQLFTDTSDLFSPVGYLSSQLFYLMLPLLVGILAISLGVSLIGREEREGTIEMLLARPISRGRLLFAKAVAGLIIVVFVGFIAGLFTALMAALVNLKVPTSYILEASLAMTILAVSFGAVAFLLSALGSAGRTASIGLSALVALGGYIIVSLVPSVSWLRWPAKMFPFNYYHSSELLTGKYNWTNMIFFACVVSGCLILSWLAFRRRDLVGD